jgi:hypothetical protein
MIDKQEALFMFNATAWKITARLVLAALVVTTGGLAQASPLSDADTRRVTIPAGDVELGATLYRPAGASGDLPAIVTAHGSAATTRDGVGFYTNAALSMGFAVLSFDKRGTGESTGEYVPFSVATSDRVFHDLAWDVAYSVQWLVDQDGIDATRIGLFGGSQAGWIMPLADTLLRDNTDIRLDFIIIGEGVPLTAGAEQAHDDALRQSVGTRQQVQRRDLFAAEAGAIAFGGETGFDPEPVLDATDTPMLWLFGLSDGVIPVLASIDRLGARIEAGETHHTVRVLPYGDHNFTNTATGERYDIATISRAWLTSLGVLD